MILYVNSCVRSESRTDMLARKLLDKLGEYTEVKLENEELVPLGKEYLDFRTEQIDKKDYTNSIFDYAKQFSQADEIVISAPFWDLSFPALLKIYIENIYVTGIVSKYGSDGRPVGLCKAKTLYYVTTAGGPYDRRYSFDYIKDMAENYFGIKETKLIMAEMLDVDGYDSEKILKDCIESYI